MHSFSTGSCSNFDKGAADGIKQDGWDDNALPEAQAAGE